MSSDDHEVRTYRSKAVLLTARVGGRAFRPFNRLAKRWHALTARKANDWASDSLYVEYDWGRNQYIIAGPHFKNDPDEYQVGHSAGKLAAVLALFPLFLMMVAVEILTQLVALLPVVWFVTLGASALLVALAFFGLAAAFQLLTLGVDYQPVDRAEVAA